MRVDVFPRQTDLVPGQPLVFSITITNTASVIGGYTVRLLGADPGWVTLDAENVSLFPDEVRTVVATVTPPAALPSGPRRLAVQVRELTPPYELSITELDLHVPVAKSLQMRVDPLTVTGGRSASFSVVAENTGNTVVSGHLDGADPENKVRFHFEPSYVSLPPGGHAVVDLRVQAARHLAGSPAPRVLKLYLDEVDDPFLNGALRPGPADGAAGAPGGSPVPPRPIPHSDRMPLANATFIQKALLSRGGISLVGLLAAISVFAIVITIGLSRLVGQSNADRDLALQVAEARANSAGTGTSAIAGTVRLLTSKKPEAGVSVSVFAESDTSKPIATTATNKLGAYRIGQLAAGGYKLSFRGAGFVQVWYPAAADASNATTVKVTAGQQKSGVDVTLGGVPATITGAVTGDDVAAATLYLETVDGTTSGPNGARAEPLTGPLTAPTPTNPTNPRPTDGGAVVQTVPVGADGTFTLTDVPSPSVYQLVVTKIGYATSTQRLDVSAGEKRTGVQIDLRKGDGLISGTASSPSGPLDGVTITATAGQSSESTVSLSGAQAGSFTLRSLPTPASYTVVARKAGYTAQTLTLSLSAGQKLTGVAISLGRSSGSLSGEVTGPGNHPAGGVSVTVTDGQRTVRTETESSGNVGTWRVGGLPVPGTYTVTFARADLASQTVSASLDAAGQVTSGSQTSRVGADGRIQVVMQTSTATVYGTVRQVDGSTVCDGSNGLGEATVTLNSGTSSYSVISASAPRSRCGDYRVEHLPPGTYTLTVAAGSGTTPSSRVLTLRAGDVTRRDVSLSQSASVGGVVRTADGAALHGWSVFLYAADDYPGRVTRTTRTDSSGHFALAGVDAGEYVIATGPSADPANAEVTRRLTVQPSKRTNITIVVQQ